MANSQRQTIRSGFVTSLVDGGTNVTANSSGVQISKLLYRPWGETRYSTGTTPTTWRFTGQREDATIGLYFYNARYLDPQLGRFTQADTIVPEPGDPQALNRYSYVLNNALRYNDPTGHFFVPIVFGIVFVGLIAYDYLAHPDIAYAPALNVDVSSLPPSDLPDNDAALCGPCPYIKEGQWAMAVVMGAVELTPLDELPGVNKVIREAADATIGPTFRSFTQRNFRENLQRLTGRSAGDIAEMEAHHVLPQKFARDFQKAGIDNIHDPRFGSWVDAAAHRTWSHGYNAKWGEFFRQRRSPEEIMRFARQLAEEYGFDVNFDVP